MLRLLEANTKEYKELASAQILGGHDVWGPLALSDGKLVMRDLGRMVCIKVKKGRWTGEGMTADTGVSDRLDASAGKGSRGAHQFR